MAQQQNQKEQQQPVAADDERDKKMSAMPAAAVKEEEQKPGGASTVLESGLKQWELCCQRALTGLMWLMKDGDDIKTATERWHAKARQAALCLSHLEDSLKPVLQALSPATKEGLDVRHAVHDSKLYLTDLFVWASAAEQVADLAFALEMAIKTLITHIKLQLSPGEEAAHTTDWLPLHRQRISGIQTDLSFSIVRLRGLTVTMTDQAKRLGAHPCVTRLISADEQQRKEEFAGLSWHEGARDSMDEMLRSLVDNLSLARLCGLKNDDEPADVVVVPAADKKEVEKTPLPPSSAEKQTSSSPEKENLTTQQQTTPTAPCSQPAEEWLRRAYANKRQTLDLAMPDFLTRLFLSSCE